MISKVIVYPYLLGILSVLMVNYIILLIIGNMVNIQNEGTHGQGI